MVQLFLRVDDPFLIPEMNFVINFQKSDTLNKGYFLVTLKRRQFHVLPRQSQGWFYSRNFIFSFEQVQR